VFKAKEGDIVKDLKSIAFIGALTITGMVVLFMLNGATTGLHNYGAGGYRAAVCKYVTPPAGDTFEQCINTVQETCYIMHTPYLTLQSKFDDCFNACVINGGSYCRMNHNT
jgi:hypothetical protein